MCLSSKKDIYDFRPTSGVSSGEFRVSRPPVTLTRRLPVLGFFTGTQRCKKILRFHFLFSVDGECLFSFMFNSGKTRTSRRGLVWFGLVGYVCRSVTLLPTLQG